MTKFIWYACLAQRVFGDGGPDIVREMASLLIAEWLSQSYQE